MLSNQMNRIVEAPSLGSQVLSDEDREILDAQNELYIKDLMVATEESTDAKKFLNAPLGRALRKYIIVSKQQNLMEIGKNRGDDSARDKAQYSYDVICGVEQLFAQILVDGETALQHLEYSQGT